ncbi:hypothetical protein GCM10009661_11160 [Catellatospora chokoriensis]
MFALVPVAFPAYLHHDALVDADREVDRIGAALAHLGASIRHWPLEPESRTEANAKARMQSWASREHDLPHSMLAWIGHGAANQDSGWLAAYDTAATIVRRGISVDTVAGPVSDEWLERSGDEGAWSIVLIQACGAGTFAKRLIANLLGKPRDPQRLILIGVGSEGAAYLGAVGDALEEMLEKGFSDNDDSITLADFAYRLRAYLGRRVGADLVVHEFAPDGGTPLRRSPVVPGGVTAPVNVYHELRAFLERQPPDVRGHFVPKAQGAELSELAWYFVGRSRERGRVAGWLKDTACGMLVVTGGAGSGKSALLGNVVVHSNTRLRDLLVDAGFIVALPDAEQPPPEVFDGVIHLAGMTTADLVRRLAEVAGINPAARAAADLDALVKALSERTLTVLLDAMDEAQEPAVIAGSVLRRIAALPAVRVVVGTRPSVHDPQRRNPVTELLDALGAGPTTSVLWVPRDTEATEEYVRLRLNGARKAGRLRATATAVADAAATVAGNGEFLFARLAVHEILARPRILAPKQAKALAELLGKDQRELFAAAVTRLSAVSATFDPLMEALALSRGRGLPRSDGIWATVATALTSGRAVTEGDIDQLLDAAAPYILLDVEDGQSVYRLSHHNFREHFESRLAASA